MDQLLHVLIEIRDGINLINSNISELQTSVENIQGIGLYNSLSDVSEKLDSLNEAVDSIKGIGYNDTLSDVCDKLDDVTSALSSIETWVSLIE